MGREKGRSANIGRILFIVSRRNFVQIVLNEGVGFDSSPSSSNQRRGAWYSQRSKRGKFSELLVQRNANIVDLVKSFLMSI